MRSLPIPLRWYLSAVYLCALILVTTHIPLLVAWRPLTHDHLIVVQGAALVAFLGYMCERIIFSVSPAVEFSLSEAVFVAAILLFPQPLPLFIALLSVSMAQFQQPKDLYKRVFNIANITLSVGISGIVFTEITKGRGDAAFHLGQIAATLPSLALLVCLYPALNSALLTMVLGLLARRSPLEIGWRNLRAIALPNITTSSTGVLAAVLWRNGPAALLLLLLPIITLYGMMRGIQQATEVEERNKAILVRVTTDERTNLPNQQTFKARLAEEVSRATRYGQSLSLLLIDLDDFRQINNAYGSHASDATVRGIAAILREDGRLFDIATYYGDDEFAVILPETDEDGALKVGTRLCQQITDLQIVHGDATFHVTASVGMAMWPVHATSAAELIRAAQQAVYAAKVAGKGRVIGASEHSIVGNSPVATLDEATDSHENGDRGGGMVVRLSDHRR